MRERKNQIEGGSFRKSIFFQGRGNMNEANCFEEIIVIFTNLFNSKI